MRAETELVPGGPPPLAGVLVTIAGVGVLAAIVLAVEPLRTGVGDALQGDTASLRENLRDLGLGGVLIVLALALAHSVVFYPAEILDAAAGFVYGFWAGFALLMAGWAVNALVSYWIGHEAGRPLLYRIFGARRFLGYERLVAKGGVTLLLAMRLVPVVPFSLFSMAAGAARVPVWRFLWTTTLGYIPITALFVYLGSRLEELSLSDPVIWIGAAVLLALLALGRPLARRIGRESRLAAGEADGDQETAAIAASISPSDGEEISSR